MFLNNLRYARASRPATVSSFWRKEQLWVHKQSLRISQTKVPREAHWWRIAENYNKMRTLLHSSLVKICKPDQWIGLLGKTRNITQMSNFHEILGYESTSNNKLICEIFHLRSCALNSHQWNGTSVYTVDRFSLDYAFPSLPKCHKQGTPNALYLSTLCADVLILWTQPIIGMMKTYTQL